MLISCKPKVSMSLVVSNCVVLLERPTAIFSWTPQTLTYHHKLRSTVDDEQVLVCRVVLILKPHSAVLSQEREAT